MKSIPLFAGALALTLITPIFPQSAAIASIGGSAKPDVDFCRDVVLPQVPAANLGECVSYSETDYNCDAGFATHDCDAFLEGDPVGFYLTYDSFNQCVRENHGD